jgi:maestro heat-like repeat-containing protein family member 1
MNCVSNFKSQWSEIRSNAALFLGYLLGNLNQEKQSFLSKEHITNGLIKLLKEDPVPLVRCRAADAISLLSEF